MSTPRTRIAVNGASGRMGSRLCALILAEPSLELASATTRASSPRVGTSACPGYDTMIGAFPGKIARDRVDVIIDFSSEQGAIDAANLARTHSIPLVTGTTGLSKDAVEKVRAASDRAAVLIAPNTSLGVAVAARLVSIAAALLKGYELSLVEAHHSAKKDAPSGTALRLAAAAREAGGNLPDHQVLAVRGGDVIGEHTLRLAGPGEYLEITHRATSRDLFVRGAIRAATWLAGRKPGLYTINDVLGLG